MQLAARSAMLLALITAIVMRVTGIFPDLP
jgi:hypothetical protein